MKRTAGFALSEICLAIFAIAIIIAVFVSTSGSYLNLVPPNKFTASPPNNPFEQSKDSVTIVERRKDWLQYTNAAGVTSTVTVIEFHRQFPYQRK